MGGNFDGYSLFKYLTENILTDRHCLSPYTCKRCIVFKQFDRLNFDGSAGKCQKRQNFSHQNFVLKTLFDQVVHHSEYIHSVIVRTLISSIIDLYRVYKIYSTIIQVIKRSTHLSLVYIIITHIWHALVCAMKGRYMY